MRALSNSKLLYAVHPRGSAFSTTTFPSDVVCVGGEYMRVCVRDMYINIHSESLNTSTL